ncbi:MAG: hypothetical protein FJZ47_04680 [Candidatus Tectomicrobia bacterium]|uniref:Uncharacterized protein n=1 Tax=Tectimicrobiota bacterium TaxID=2528274 RepID=A0A937VXS9_UNCTE|nr:hypothetical protein [Candidatus Tectomicrobia bacterium]
MQRLLEAASVVGTTFATAAVAAGTQRDIQEVETICAHIAQQGHLLVAEGLAEWPDGTLSGRYRFRHVFAQQALYERIDEARLVGLHTRIGQRLAASYGPHAHTIASDLRRHFARGRDRARAAQYPPGRA